MSDERVAELEHLVMAMAEKIWLMSTHLTRLAERSMSIEKVVIGDCTLYRGDCLEILPTLPKVDAVVTDID